ncbi:MAG TPA: PD-(D/E)XK nuclease family protein [Bacilli bacterium]|nr:PD-(D/E)XK nuclease family protein [Bacilli bacterium]
MNERLFTYDYIVAPVQLHRHILRLKADNPRTQTKLISKEELINSLTFKVEADAIYEIIENFQFSYQKAKNYLDNLEHFSKSDMTAKLREMFDVYEHLLSKGMVKFDETNFVYQNKSALLINYSSLDSELISTLNKLEIRHEFYQVAAKTKTMQIRTFSDVGQETQFFFNQVAELLANGVAPQDIYVFTPASAYEHDFKLWVQEYNIPLNVFNTKPLYNFPLVQDLFRQIGEHGPDLEVFLNEKFNQTKLAPELVETLKIIGRFPQKNLTLKLYLELLKDQISKKELIISDYANSLPTLQTLPLFLSEKHIFILGFSKGRYPLVSLDNEFISDKEKSAVGLNTSKLTNEINNDLLRQVLTTDNYFHLSFSQSVEGQKQILSDLVEEFKMEVVTDNVPRVFYNKTYLESYYASLVDNLRKYNAFDSKIDLLYPLLSENNYSTYDNKFTGVNHFRADSPLSLSFSQIDTFYGCPFRYYLDRVLKLRTTSNVLSLEIGNLFHHLMEISDHKPIDLESEIDTFLSTNEFAAREKMLIRGMSEIFKVGLRLKGELELQMKMEKTNAEIDVHLQLDELTSIKGRIDRVYELKNGGLVLIDYKTGVKRFNVNQIEYGKSLQLPIYALMSINDERFKDKYILGLFLQKLKQEGILICEDEEERYQHFKSQFKMSGIMLDDSGKLEEFDSTFMGTHSSFVTGLMYSNAQGRFHAKAPVFKTDFFDEIANRAKDKITEAARRIRKNDFVVTPLLIDKDDACGFCPFANVCYKKKEDYIVVNTKATEEDNDGTE